MQAAIPLSSGQPSDQEAIDKQALEGVPSSLAPLESLWRVSFSQNLIVGWYANQSSGAASVFCPWRNGR